MRVAIFIVNFFAASQFAYSAALREPNNSQTSAIVVRLRDGATLYSQNANKLLIPASVSKLVLAAAALDTLGPATVFTTEVKYDGTLSNSGNLNGNIYIVGSADPMLTSEKMWQFAADLKNMGIKNISGDLVIDQSMFADEKLDPSRTEGLERSQNAYDAPVSPFAVNFNSVAMIVSPAPEIGSPGLVAFDPVALSGAQIENKTTTSKGEKSSLKAQRLSVDSETSKIIVSGSVAAQDAPIKIYRSVMNTSALHASYVRGFLHGVGIVIHGKSLKGKSPPEAKLLYGIESDPLARHIHGMNKFSNNFVADMLSKKIAVIKNNRTATWKDASAALTDFFRNRVGVRSEFTLDNASGLSPKNRLSSEQLVKLLRFVDDNPLWSEEFKTSLPVSSTDGTLKKRFQTTSGLVVRAKTGMLSEPTTAVSLAGYAWTQAHGWSAFALITNGTNKNPQPDITSVQSYHEALLNKSLKTSPRSSR